MRQKPNHRTVVLSSERAPQGKGKCAQQKVQPQQIVDGSGKSNGNSAKTLEEKWSDAGGRPAVRENKRHTETNIELKM